MELLVYFLTKSPNKKISVINPGFKGLKSTKIYDFQDNKLIEGTMFTFKKQGSIQSKLSSKVQLEVYAQFSLVVII